MDINFMTSVMHLAKYHVNLSCPNFTTMVLEITHLVINGVHFCYAEATTGVPQWSLLGPMLFLLYTNDMNNAITSQIKLLADEMKWKCVIFMCYSSEKLITLNTLHEVVPTWYSFHSWVDWSNADKVSCSRRKHIDAGVRTVYLLYPKSTL